MKIDVVILSFNEEDVIEDAVKSVKDWAENVLVIDAGSQDKTVELSKKAGAKVIENSFSNFSEQRNFALKHITSPWVLYLDADERVTDAFRKELSEQLGRIDEDVAALEVERKTFYFGRDWGFSDTVTRVFRVSNFKKWTGVVHETAHFEGKTEKISEPILHFTHRNLEQMINKTNKWSEYEAQLRLDANHPPMQGWRFIRVMITAFLRSYIKEKGYKNGTVGLIESVYQAFSMFITYAKLWEKQKKQ